MTMQCLPPHPQFRFKNRGRPTSCKTWWSHDKFTKCAVDWYNNSTRKSTGGFPSRYTSNHFTKNSEFANFARHRWVRRALFFLVAVDVWVVRDKCGTAKLYKIVAFYRCQRGGSWTEMAQNKSERVAQWAMRFNKCVCRETWQNLEWHMLRSILYISLARAFDFIDFGRLQSTCERPNFKACMYIFSPMPPDIKVSPHLRRPIMSGTASGNGPFAST